MAMMALRVPVATARAVVWQSPGRPVVQEPPAVAKLSHKPTSSMVSTTSTAAPASSLGSASDVAEDEVPWSVHQTIRLGALNLQQEAALARDGMRVLDRGVVSSVSTVVDWLNRGKFECPEGCCVVFSASSKMHFLVYRQGLQHHALALAAKYDDPAQGFVVLPDDQVCTTSRRGRSPSPVIPPETPKSRSVPRTKAPLKTPTSQAAPATPVLSTEDAARGKVKAEAGASGDSPRARTAAWSHIGAMEDWARIGAELRSALEAAAHKEEPETPSTPLKAADRKRFTRVVEKPDDQQAPAPQEDISEQDSLAPEPEAASAIITQTIDNSLVPETPSRKAPEAGSGKLPSKGSEMEIGGHIFQMAGVLGRGAFGVVRKATESTPSGKRTVAVKTMSAKTPDALDVAVFESELLKTLTERLPAESAGRVPYYVAHSTTASGSGGVVRLAMSYVPGVVLDQWLYGISDAEHKRVEVTELVGGRLPGGRQRTVPLAASCRFTSVLLTQMAGVLAVLKPIAFHRDISSHNVLVNFGSADPDGAKALNPSFALIDFGLAVKSGTWRKNWSSSNLAGDPRYWTAPAWMAFAFGFSHIENHSNQGFMQQYLGRIDHYSLGVLGLEMLFALWDEEQRHQDEPAPGMMEVRAAWIEFWEAAVRIFQMFHCAGPQATREFLANAPKNEGIARVVRLLARVRELLRKAASEPSMASKASLLQVLADLVDEHGTLDWDEVVVALTTDSLPRGMRQQPVAKDAAGAASGQGPTPKAVSDALATSRHHLGLQGGAGQRGRAGTSAIRMRTLSPTVTCRGRELSPTLSRTPSQLLPIATARATIERKSAMAPHPIMTGRHSYVPPQRQVVSYVPQPVSVASASTPMKASTSTPIKAPGRLVGPTDAGFTSPTARRTVVRSPLH